MSRFGPTGISETSDDPRHFPSFPMHVFLSPILHHDCLTVKVEACIPYTLCFPQQLHFSSPKSSDRLLHAALHSKNRSDGVASLLLYPSGITPFTISNGFGLGFMAEYDQPGYCFLSCLPSWLHLVSLLLLAQILTPVREVRLQKSAIGRRPPLLMWCMLL